MSQGILYIVATPIGNLQDISLRALEVLKKVGVIAAEDTRHSKPLLQHYGIDTSCISLHAHNEAQKSQAIIARLLAGESVAIISDAGTPLISDPGYKMVTAACEHNIKVVPIPGSSACIAALSVAGLASDRFCFEGFLPAKSGARCSVLESVKQESRTLIFYEAPHRALACLEDMMTVLGQDRRAVVARELTKLYEDVRRGSLHELIAHYQTHQDQIKGEFVILLEGEKKRAHDKVFVDVRHLLKTLLTESSLKHSVSMAAMITGLKKNSLYDLALTLE